MIAKASCARCSERRGAYYRLCNVLFCPECYELLGLKMPRRRETLRILLDRGVPPHDLTRSLFAQ